MSTPTPFYTERFSYYTPKLAVREFNHAVASSSNYRPLLAAIEEKGYEISDDDGFASQYEIAPTPIEDLPPGYTHGDPQITNYKFGMAVIKIHTEAGEDRGPAAICLAKIEPSGHFVNQEAIEHISIITAVRNDFMNVEEEVFSEGAFGALGANGNDWWTRLMSRVQDCGGVCVGAAIGCPKTDWTTFLACIAGRCGECLVKAAACATCNCATWCKWAASCCQ